MTYYSITIAHYYECGKGKSAATFGSLNYPIDGNHLFGEFQLAALNAI
jgi:hypothetical protein